jgi:hypothetical protein
MLQRRGNRMTRGEEPREIQVSFQNGDSETLFVTPMGQNLYRMEESSALGEASYHDVIEGELQADGTVRFIRICTPSGLKTVSWILLQSLVESPGMTALLDKVMAAGGNWERIFGGVLIVHLPPAEYDSLVQEFNALFSDDSPPAS